MFDVSYAFGCDEVVKCDAIGRGIMAEILRNSLFFRFFLSPAIVVFKYRCRKGLYLCLVIFDDIFESISLLNSIKRSNFSRFLFFSCDELLHYFFFEVSFLLVFSVYLYLFGRLQTHHFGDIIFSLLLLFLQPSPF